MAFVICLQYVLYVCLSVIPSLHLSVILSVIPCASFCLSIIVVPSIHRFISAPSIRISYLSVYPAFYLFIVLSVFLSYICLSFHLSIIHFVCLHIFFFKV